MNPPYQKEDGGYSRSAIPLYNLFVEDEIKNGIKTIVALTPAKWMSGGRNLDKFRKHMIKQARISEIHHWTNAKQIFKCVQINGGISLFKVSPKKQKSYKIHSHRYNGDFTNTVKWKSCKNYIKWFPELSCLENKVKTNKKLIDYIHLSRLPSNWFSLKKDVLSETPTPESYRVFGRINNRREIRYISKKDMKAPADPALADKFKVFVPLKGGGDVIGQRPNPDIIPKSVFIGGPGDLCTSTYIAVGPFDTEQQAQNAVTFFQTKTIRAYVAICKMTPSLPKKIFQNVPVYSFDSPVTDEWLFREIGLTDDEIDTINEYL